MGAPIRTRIHHRSELKGALDQLGLVARLKVPGWPDSVNCIGGAPHSAAAPRAITGYQGGKIKKSQIFVLFDCFKGPEGFQGVPGARGYILTEFGPKRTHQTLVHTKFDDFCLVFLC